MKKAHWLALFLAMGLLVPRLGIMGMRLVQPVSAGTSRATTSGLDPPPLSSEIVISALDNEQHLPSVAYNSKHDEYLVVWHNKWPGNRDIYAQRVTSRGELKSSFILHTAGTNDRAQPSVAYDPVNDRYLVVWIYDYHGDGSDWDVRGRLIPWNGPSASLTEFVICDWTTTQLNPKVVYARAQEEFLVVWTNTYTAGVPPAYISGHRVKAADGTFPTGGFTIASHGSENRVNPDVAYNLTRNEYLVTYDNGVDIYGVRLKGDGGALGGGEFGIATWPDTEIHPAVAAGYNADQYLVVWQSLQPAGHYDVYARFIKGDGTPDSVDVISNLTGDQEEADVAYHPAGRYMITWQERVATYGISGRLMLVSKVLGTGFQIVPPGSSPGHKNPAVAAGDQNYLVAWEHQRGVTIYRDIHGRLIFGTPPTACFTVNPTSGDTNTTFQFNADCCTDKEDPTSALEVMWDWGDGGGVNFTTTKTATHRYAMPGTYTVTLHVKDTATLTDSTTRQVTVSHRTFLPMVLKKY